MESGDADSAIRTGFHFLDPTGDALRCWRKEQKTSWRRWKYLVSCEQD